MGTTKVKRLHLENKISHGHVEVSCINFHSFVLGIHEDGKQRNFHLGDGQYKLSTNSTSLLVSAMSKYNKF